MPSPTEPTKPKSADEVECDGMSLQAIADELGVTRSTVRQIEADALAKLAYRIWLRRLNPDDFNPD